MSIHDSTIAEDVKVLMLKGEKGDTGYPTVEQVSEALAENVSTLIEPWMDESGAGAIGEWLSDHPEATTTVQDSSLTESKFTEALRLKTIKDYVTPEMFGAVGDGVADDTVAWQNAVDSGLSVKATQKKYKCGQINVTNNIDIDCNGAEFICTADKLFYCSGEVVTTLENEADYTANQSGYMITDASYADYTGFAMLKGTNNFEKSRDYYRGGFVCEFHNGLLTNTYPIDVTDVSIEIINPITVHIANIGDIHQSISPEDYSISIKYGFGCTIRDCNINHSGAYVVIMLDSCLNCICENCNIKQMYTSSNNNSYLVSLSNSSYCTICDCYMFNKNWHCITTGDTYLCYHNIVDKCKLYTHGSYAYEDHENALNSIITNSTVAGIGLSGLGVIDNCDLMPIVISPYNCLIRILAMSNIETAVYNVSNVRFHPKTGTSANYVGVWFSSSGRNAGTTYYIKNCNFDNLKNCNKDCQAEFRFGAFSSNSTNIVYDVSINNCNLYYYFAKTGEAYVDISKYTLTISNCTALGYDNQYYPAMGGGSYEFNNVILNNVKMHQITGKFHNLHINGFWCRNGFGSSTNVTNELFGSLINSVIRTSAILSALLVRISDMRDGSAQLFNIGTAVNGNVYYQQYDNSGVLTTYQLTA